jgi:DNA-binding MarR family transcriptional regulator
MNHRKLAILRLLARVSDTSAADIATGLGINLPATGMALLRLTRNGLIARTYDAKQNRLFYSLTPKGATRLRVLEADDD